MSETITKLISASIIPNSKFCICCKELKLRSEFYNFNGPCKKCRTARHRERYKQNLARYRAYGNSSYHRRKVETGALRRQRHNLWMANLKAEFISAYGGVCICCGESSPEFLTVEHRLGNGRQHRKKIGNNGHSMWIYLKRHGWPKDEYTLLCWNCNMATRYGHPCPHGNYMRLQKVS